MGPETGRSCYLLGDSSTRHGLFLACSSHADLRRDVEAAIVRMSCDGLSAEALVHGHGALTVIDVQRGTLGTRVNLRDFLVARVNQDNGPSLTFPLMDAPPNLFKVPYTSSWRFRVDWAFLDRLPPLQAPLLAPHELTPLLGQHEPLPCETQLDGVRVRLGVNDVQFQNLEHAREVMNLELDRINDWLAEIQLEDPWP